MRDCSAAKSRPPGAAGVPVVDGVPVAAGGAAGKKDGIAAPPKPLPIIDIALCTHHSKSNHQRKNT